ncbi:hypothetical protein [Methanothrix soehngenii]|uniref:hypothetical protein n=1 Tax=Methanothrix soehngenii TaxID=2223 RepID=UPI00300CF704
MAQIDIQFSNSMIESFFHQLKNHDLYFRDIHILPVLADHIDFYVYEHNEVIPFLALGGATPLKAYISPGSVIVNKVKYQEITKAAIQNRIQFHRSLTCPFC